jgi:hypothetical protein
MIDPRREIIAQVNATARELGWAWYGPASRHLGNLEQPVTIGAQVYGKGKVYVSFGVDADLPQDIRSDIWERAMVILTNELAAQGLTLDLKTYDTGGYSTSFIVEA